jgi:hypothetical protein
VQKGKLGSVGTTEAPSSVTPGVCGRFGIHFPTIDFDQNFVAEALQTDEGYAFMIRADGRSGYQLGFKVDLRDKNDSPLGLHRFDPAVPGHYFSSGFSGAGLLNTEVVKSRVSQTGMILFTEDSNKRAAGAVFGLVLENAFGEANGLDSVCPVRHSALGLPGWLTSGCSGQRCSGSARC